MTEEIEEEEAEVVQQEVDQEVRRPGGFEVEVDQEDPKSLSFHTELKVSKAASGPGHTLVTKNLIP